MAGKDAAILAIIFDIDDTLVQTGQIEADCFPRAVREVLGDVTLRPSWGDYEHVTDTGIFGDICEDNDLPNTGLPAVTQRFVEILQDQLARCPAQGAAVPGAQALLNRLGATPDIRFGCATGGWDAPARIKLRHSGIAPPPAFASSCDAAERTRIMQTCLARMEPPIDHVIYVGDGDWDARASAALGWSFIAVDPALRDQGHRWVPDFSTGAFDRHIEDIRARLRDGAVT